MYTELMSLFRGESALTFLHKKGYILNLYKKPIKKTKKNKYVHRFQTVPQIKPRVFYC